MLLVTFRQVACSICSALRHWCRAFAPGSVRILFAPSRAQAAVSATLRRSAVKILMRPKVSRRSWWTQSCLPRLVPGCAMAARNRLLWAVKGAHIRPQPRLEQPQDKPAPPGTPVDVSREIPHFRQHAGIGVRYHARALSTANSTREIHNRSANNRCTICIHTGANSARFRAPAPSWAAVSASTASATR